MQLGKFNVSKGLAIGIGTALALLFVVIWFVSAYNGARNGAIDRETHLSAQYLDNQNELSTYVVKIKEQLQVADRKTDKLDQVLTDAVTGRYDGETSAQPGQGQLFSAIVEAYPDLDLSVYDRVQDSVSAGRDAFKNKQSALLDRLREYDKWRESGLIHSRLVAIVGVPTNRLEARLGDQKLQGDVARDQMYKLVLAAESTKSFQTGTMTSLDLNPTTTKP